MKFWVHQNTWCFERGKTWFGSIKSHELVKNAQNLVGSIKSHEIESFSLQSYIWKGAHALKASSHTMYINGGSHLKSIFIYKNNTGQFAMSHGYYEMNLDSEILIIAGREVGSILLGHIVYFSKNLYDRLWNRGFQRNWSYNNVYVNGQFCKV